MGGYRHFSASKIYFKWFAFSNTSTYVRIDNTVSSLLYKTNDFSKIEKFKDALS